MWCRHCQQQTPALGPPSAVGPRCGRCGRTTPTEPAAATAATAPSPLDDADEARRAIYRSLRSAHATLSAGEAARTLRYDLPETPLAEAYHQRRPSPDRRPPRHATASRPSVAPPAPRGQLPAWLSATLGAAALGVGVGVGAWSLLGARPDLWDLALALTLGGQGLMILGLVQLLASLSRAARHATVKLAQVHDELRRLRRLADESAGRHHASAAGFYADLARDAPPERLLGNLRGQLDRLASRLRAG
ncbi:hypothetical protein [Botrimarina sp.]|uniref:hypothetical protein n=1 Tax=Botrimarina sp. TaxID=2795802 RepID=UPI0032ED748C